mgnify:CR=1 FL=1
MISGSVGGIDHEVGSLPHRLDTRRIRLVGRSDERRRFGAGLAETILYCRHKIYPLGLPNGLSHFLTAIAVIFSTFVGVKASFLPERSKPVSISFIRNGELQGTFAVLIVTTLEKLLLGVHKLDLI